MNATAHPTEWTKITGTKQITASDWQIQMRWTRDRRTEPVRAMIASEVHPAIGIRTSASAHGSVLDQPTDFKSIFHVCSR